MNSETPLIREGLKPIHGKPSFFFKVMLILAVHLVIIGGLLLQGCKSINPKDASLTPSAPDTAPPADAATPDQKPPPTVDPVAPKELASQPPAPHQRQATLTPTQAVRPPLSASLGTLMVYTVKPGDTLGKIARLNHTSSDKIKTLNGLKSAFLKIGQKLKVPAPKAA